MLRDTFTASERAVLRRLGSPERIQRFLAGLAYNKEPDGPALVFFLAAFLDKAGEAAGARKGQSTRSGWLHWNSRGEQLEIHAAKLPETLVDGGQPHLPGDGKRGQIGVSHEFAGGCRVSQQFRQYGIQESRLGRELHPLVLQQLCDQIPRRRSGNNVLPHDSPIPQQSDQRQLHEAAKNGFSGR
jgi:hypothetical protein